MGRMSSKRIPGDGKSGNWRRAERSLTLRLASSVVREGWAGDCPETWVVVASGAVDWDMVEREERENKGKERGERRERRRSTNKERLNEET